MIINSELILLKYAFAVCNMYVHNAPYKIQNQLELNSKFQTIINNNLTLYSFIHNSQLKQNIQIHIHNEHKGIDQPLIALPIDNEK